MLHHTGLLCGGHKLGIYYKFCDVTVCTILAPSWDYFLTLIAWNKIKIEFLNYTFISCCCLLCSSRLVALIMIILQTPCRGRSKPSQARAQTLRTRAEPRAWISWIFGIKPELRFDIPNALMPWSKHFR